MSVVTGTVDVVGRRFTPGGQSTSVEVYRTPPQAATLPELVDLTSFAGLRVAIVCDQIDGAVWGAKEIGHLVATTIRAQKLSQILNLAPRGSVIRLDDGLFRPRCEIAVVNRDATSSAAEAGIAGTRRLPMHQTIYVHRHGGRFFGAGQYIDNSSQNVSSVVWERGYEHIDMKPFAGSDAKWAAVLAGMRDRFAKFNVTITDTRPAQGDYILAAITGNSGQIFNLGTNTIGYSPMGCSIIPNAVSFTFTEYILGDDDMIAETAAHEAGHCISLDHERLHQELMNFQIGYGRQTFIDRDIAVGDDDNTWQHCQKSTQNSFRRLLEILGPPGPPPVPVDPFVVITSPADGAQLLVNSEISVVAEVKEGVTLSSIELLWDFTEGSLACPGSGTDWNCSVAGRIHTWRLSVGTGNRSFRVNAVDAQGNVTTTNSRSIQLVGGPPTVYQFPKITVKSPAPDSTFRRGQPFRVEAQVHSDGSPVQGVEMVWSGGPGDGYSYPLPSAANEIWALDTSMSEDAAVGMRQLSIKARTERGEVSVTPPMTLHVV